jgi:hypothetical protein
MPNTAYTESYGGETRNDWTMLDKTISSGSHEDDGCMQATGNYTRRGAETVATDSISSRTYRTRHGMFFTKFQLPATETKTGNE